MLDREQYDRFRVTPNDPAALRNRDVERILKKLADFSDGRLKVEKFDESNEGRPIYLATLGAGPRRVLLWSQMHGDEPTHTAVMLDLFSYLLQEPAKTQADEILSGCTLMFLPMLNPDGAEAVIRFNAQGIDINRDWRRQATPEGRALLRAAKTLKPQFGFNLHNQNARTSVGRPPRPAAVSVLAPPTDASRTESPSMRTAKQMCTCFIEAVRPPVAEGMISRYDDTYEPRAFGDGIQSLGVATMLVEAGGWPEADPEPLTRLHFQGMLATLHAIATDKYREADHQIYEDLPKSNSLRLDDCLITKANVLDAKVARPFVADIAIDQTESERLAVTSNRDGKIVDIGDLPGVVARLTINGSNSLVIPGQFTFIRDWKGAAFDERRVAELLARGTTTVLGLVDLADHHAIETLAKPQLLPFNWAFVGNVDTLDRLRPGEVIERIAIAAAGGIVGVVSSGTDEELWKVIHQFGLTLIKSSQLPEKAAGSYQDAAKQAWNIATALTQQTRRGRINRNYVADLLFFSDVSNQKASDAIDWKKLARVMVAGETVWENGSRIGGTPGVFLRRI